MTIAQRLVLAMIEFLARLLCRVHDEQLSRVPERGPLVMVSNHINFIEAPLLYTHLRPRPVTGFAKVESWDNPLIGFIVNIGRAIPIRRGEADVNALQRALAALKDGYIFGLAPEGTRSGHGRLLRGHPGAVMLALHSGAPILPVVHYGGEKFWHNLIRLRRTDFHIVVGNPFYLKAAGVRVTREVRQQMTDEIMYQMAALLPPAYRGHYSNLDAATETYLRFPEGSPGHLRRVHE